LGAFILSSKFGRISSSSSFWKAINSKKKFSKNNYLPTHAHLGAFLLLLLLLLFDDDETLPTINKTSFYYYKNLRTQK
jgi:hypothetical protein